MKYPVWPSVARFALPITSKRVLVIGASCILTAVAALGSTYLLYDTNSQQSVKKLDTNTKIEHELAQPDTAAEAAPVAESPSTTPPPMNRPGNRYVLENSAGPVKLTYREQRSLIISPTTLTLYTTSGATPASGFIAEKLYSFAQVTSDDGQIVTFPFATDAGGVSFGVQTDTTTPPPNVASWKMIVDAQSGIPGTYTATLTSWSLDHQIRYTGTIQLTIVQAANYSNALPY